MNKYIDVIEFNNWAETVFWYYIDEYGKMVWELYDIDSWDNYLVEWQWKWKIEEDNVDYVERNYDKDLAIYVFKKTWHDTIEYIIRPDWFYYDIES